MKTKETNEEQEFAPGQIVSVDWDKLGEITEYLWSGYYHVWVEQDGKGIYATIHAKRLDGVAAFKNTPI